MALMNDNPWPFTPTPLPPVASKVRVPQSVTIVRAVGGKYIAAVSKPRWDGDVEVTYHCLTFSELESLLSNLL